MKFLSDLYNVTLKRDYRGIASEGYVRPTVTQFYTCNKPFNLIQSRANITVSPNLGEDIIFSDKIQLSEAGEYTVTTDKEVNVYCKLWGAAGGRYGGVGGYTYGEVLLQPNITYKIWTGGGGLINFSSSIGVEGGFGGGGNCGRTNHASYYRGSGGGLTGLFLTSVIHSNSILIAGGGGGAGHSYGTAGNGGGLTGGTGKNSGNGGGGGAGTQINGGAVGAIHNDTGAIPGSELKGGNAASALTKNFTGGGGGAGYYGGGPGGGNNYAGGYGGGGSSFIHPTLVQNGQTIQLSARGGEVPNNTDLDYINNAGMPTTTNGNDGLFVISIIS